MSTGGDSCSDGFQVGETVSVKRYGNAVIVSGPVEEPGPFLGRYQVRYPDGKLYYARPNSLRRFEQPPCRVLVAETTDHYRAAAQTYCHPGDVVLEVGSSYGVTCDLINQRGAQVLGIDKSRELVADARAKFPHLRFEVQDAFDIPALKALSPSGSFDKICVDIGGIAELHTVMLLVGLYFRAFRQSVLIVKSKYLKTLLGNVQVFVPPEQRRLQQQGAHVHKQPGSQVQGTASVQAAAELTPQAGMQQLCQQGHSVQSTEECNGTSS